MNKTTEGQEVLWMVLGAPCEVLGVLWMVQMVLCEVLEDLCVVLEVPCKVLVVQGLEEMINL